MDRQVFSRRRQLTERELARVVGRLAAGESLARCATDLGVTRSTLTQALLSTAWRAYVADLGFPGVGRPEGL